MRSKQQNPSSEHPFWASFHIIIGERIRHYSAPRSITFKSFNSKQNEKFPFSNGGGEWLGDEETNPINEIKRGSLIDQVPFDDVEIGFSVNFIRIMERERPKKREKK